MSDEEKKALERIEDFLTTNIIASISNDETADSEELKAFISKNEYLAIEVIASMFLKQSKEIEELKFKYQARKDRMQKEIEELNKSDESKEQSSMNYYNLYKELVDKIKAKIEEVEQWELYNIKIPKLSTLDERLGAKIGIKYVLQSLLEKE